MPDVSIIWDAPNGRGDWAVEGEDIQTGDDLETTVALMLFTDQILPPGVAPPDGSNDPRGWAGDSYNEQPIGSLLWTLRRTSISNVSATLQQIQDICENALASLRADGVAKSISVIASYLGRGTVAIAVQILKPDGTLANFKYQWAWMI